MLEIAKKIKILFGHIVFTLALSFAAPPNSSIASETFRVGLPSLITSLDPSKIHNVYASLINAQVFETLYCFGKNSAILPALAKSHIISPDGKTIRIVIKDNQIFSDGSTITGKNIVDALKRSIINLGENSRWAFGDLVGFDEFIKSGGKLSENFGLRESEKGVIEFRLVRAFPKFFQILANHNYSIYKKDSENNFIGSGPYKLQNFEKTKITLSKKDSQDGPEKIEFIKLNDTNHLKSLLDLQKIDLAPVTNDQIPDYSHYSKNPYHAIHMSVITFNMLHPFFKNRDNRCGFADELEASLKEAGYQWNKNENHSALSWNFFKLAKKFSKTTPSPKSIEILYPSSIARFDENKNLTAANIMRKKGWDIKFTNLDINAIDQRSANKNFDVLMFGYSAKYIDMESFLSPLLQTDQQYNMGKFSDKTLDRLLKISRALSDQSSRNIVFTEALDIVNTECPVRFLGAQDGLYIISDKWTLTQVNEVGFHHVKFSESIRRSLKRP